MTDWLIKLGITQAGPSAIRNGVQCVIAYLIVNSNVLTTWGIVTAGHITTIDWSIAGERLIVLLPVIAGMIKAGQFHGTNIIQAVTTPPQGEQPK